MQFGQNTWNIPKSRRVMLKYFKKIGTAEKYDMPEFLYPCYLYKGDLFKAY